MSIKYLNSKWILVSLCLFSLLLTAPVRALEVVCTHGHTGHIEYLERIETTERTHIGWGLDFNQKPGQVNWIHFAPPSLVNQKTRYVALQFKTGSVDAFVDRVDIYDLGSKVKQFDNLGWSGEELQFQVLDLGSDIPFIALGISVQVKTGVEMMSHRFIFTGACASKEL